MAGQRQPRHMRTVQALLAIALVVVVLRINLYNLPLPGGGGVASRHANFPVQAETVQSGAAPDAARRTLRPAHGKAQGKAMQPCEGACPCVTRNRHHVVSCPCWEHTCGWTAPTPPDEKPKSGDELLAQLHEIMRPRLGEPLPGATPELPEELEEERVGAGEEEAEEGRRGNGAAAVRLEGDTLRARLRQGQFAFAGQGVEHGGDTSEGAAESFTILAAAHVDAEGVVKYTGPNQHHTSMALPPELASRLPPTDYAATGERRFRTCAVVGNSGTLLRSQMGAEIDDHDAVLRINYAPYVGFEADVGSKTTFDFSNRENARRMLKSHMNWRESTVVFFEVSSPTNRKQMFVPLAKKFPDKEFHFIHPGFVARAMELWFHLKTEVETRRHKKFHDKPMSGFMAILFLMQVCEEVDVYGFEAYTSKRANSPYHYFDNVQGVTTVHSFDMAIDIYKLLGEVYPLFLK